MDEQTRNENLEKARAAMRAAETANQVQLGGGMENVVEINYMSTMNNEYKGVVVFKRPTVMDYMKMAAIQSELYESAGISNLELVDVSIKNMAHAISVLSVVAVKRPDWLINLKAIEEPDLIFHVLAKYTRWELSFRRELPKPNSDNRTTDAGAEALDPA